MLKCLERKRLETKYDLHPQAAPQYLHITVTATILYTLEKRLPSYIFIFTKLCLFFQVRTFVLLSFNHGTLVHTQY